MPDRLEIVRQSIAALNRRDVDTAVGVFASDSEEMFEYLRAEVEEAHELGDVVLAFGRLEVKGRESGAAVELVISWVFRFAGDKVIWAKSFADRDEAIAECGFEPPGVPRTSGSDPEETR